MVAMLSLCSFFVIIMFFLPFLYEFRGLYNRVFDEMTSFESSDFRLTFDSRNHYVLQMGIGEKNKTSKFYTVKFMSIYTGLI